MSGFGNLGQDSVGILYSGCIIHQPVFHTPSFSPDTHTGFNAVVFILRYNTINLTSNKVTSYKSKLSANSCRVNKLPSLHLLYFYTLSTLENRFMNIPKYLHSPEPLVLKHAEYVKAHTYTCMHYILCVHINSTLLSCDRNAVPTRLSCYLECTVLCSSVCRLLYFQSVVLWSHQLRLVVN